MLSLPNITFWKFGWRLTFPTIISSKLNKYLSLFLLFLLTSPFVISAEQKKPNFIIFFTDDQGYQDVGCFGAKGFETPHLDRMAQEGLKLTSFYAQAVCGPSRCTLLTGCYPMRIGEPGNVNHVHTLMHPKEVTIAEVLKTAGYKTACIGKWHCGNQTPEMGPNAQGFDYFFGSPLYNGFTPKVNQHSYRMCLKENDKIIKKRCEQKDMDQITTWYTEKAVEYIKANKKQPFFLYLAHNMPHVPLGVSDKFRGKSKLGPYGDVMMELDWSMGQILKTLKECGLDKNTLVIFTSDNGPWVGKNLKGYSGNADPLKGSKMETWEGGSRVPAIIRWPGTIKAGRVSDELCTTMDLYPTIAKLARAKIPKDRKIDGLDISSFLKGKTQKTQNQTYYYYAYNHLQAVRDKRWKLVLPREKGGAEMNFWQSHTKEVKHLQLFDLKADKEEQNNVADKHPEVVEQLMTLIKNGRADIGDYDCTGKGARFWDKEFTIETPGEIYERLKGIKGAYNGYVHAFPYAATKYGIKP